VIMLVSTAPILLDHFLYPSTIFASLQPARVQTILGSCVSVCLYDVRLCIGAMNHFMLPWWNGQGMPSPKYGDVAIRKLIEKMISLGCARENMVAKVFGGADQQSLGLGTYNIGARNVTTAETLLDQERINILTRSTGGGRGRKVLFYTHTNKVLVKFLNAN
jgi:chemotaxis protein CheD